MIIRPAGIGSMCDHWYRNPKPGPYMVRCKERATDVVVIKTPDDCYTLKRCPACAEELHQQEEAGATFEIMSEQKIGASR